MSRYPYPLRDWRKADEYPNPKDRDGTGWAWEFLRRNPEYQRLWALFDSLPDYIDFVDEYGPSSTVKCGKWKGTPWMNFRFLTGGAGWYADPEPIPGEHCSDYEARCPEGNIVPFADYLTTRFRIAPYPINPSRELPEIFWFGDEWGEDSQGPWPLDLSKPPPELVEAFPEEYASMREKRMDELAADRTKVAIVFNLRRPIQQQLTDAREMLRDSAQEDWRTGWGNEPIVKESRPHYRPREHAQHIRLLDAAAAGATLEEMAAILHPRKANGYAEGYRVTKRLRRDLKQAERLRDSEYWRLPPWKLRWE